MQTVGKSAVAHHEICDIRRRNGGWKAVEVGVETVPPGREIDRCVLTGDLQAVGLKTCERALFSHTAKPRTAPWIGAVCTQFRLQ